MLTFEQFQATRTWCEDLGGYYKTPDEWDGVIPGFLYGDGDLYIEAQDTSAANDKRWTYHLHIECEEWDSEDLTELERRLYKYGCEDGRLGRVYPPTPRELATKFAHVLLTWLKPEEMAEVRKRNATETSTHVCHSHDFCDANMAMEEAWMSFGMPSIDADDEAQATLWNEAWDIAKKQRLTADQ